MDINKVLMEYDNMFGAHSLEDIEGFLVKKLDMAYREEDNYSAVTLLNELMGFCRDTDQKAKGVGYCKQVIGLMNTMGLEGTVEYATTLLNVANAYRAFGYHDTSLELYKQVEAIYQDKLPAGEFNYASLYNNWSLLYQEMEDFADAWAMLEKALLIVDSYPKARMEQATTRVNLGATLLRLYQIGVVEEADGPANSVGNSSDSEVEIYYNKAISYLKKALKIYEEDGGRDFHYSGALAAMGDAYFIKDEYEEAIIYYERALEEIEKHVGKTDAYERVAVKHDKALKMQEKLEWEKKSTREEDEIYSNNDKNIPENIDSYGDLEKQKCNDNIYRRVVSSNPHIFNNNLERCKAFYEEYGRLMIREKFQAYVSRISVGLVGEGSDCFGYDDEVSMDHDYGVGFCMWLTEDDYNAIGVELHKEYEKLVLDHGREYFDQVDFGESMGSKAHSNIDSRRGVFTIKDFYGRLLGEDFVKNLDVNVVARTKKFNLSKSMWSRLSEDRLATATNGEIFRDDLGAFTAIRKELMSYYPKSVWLLKLADALHTFSQNGQYNYPRMMARKDYVTANICVNQAVKAAMEIIYLLNKTYAPYYKWMWKGLEGLEVLKEVRPILEDISLVRSQLSAWEEGFYNPYQPNMSDKRVVAFEAVATLILGELNEQKIVRGHDTFLDVYCREIAEKAMKNLDRKEFIDRIVRLEWQQFDKVKNEGGRAECQDDWNTFSLMRRSQYMAWSDELLESYLGDLLDAEDKGWNLIMEKYARMMKSTAPDRYSELEEQLPVRSSERIAIQEEIIRLQVEWMEEFADKYPKMAGNARSIHTSEDSSYNTSYETYLRGELGTYSEETLVRYGRFVVDIQKNGGNLAYNIMNNTAKLYGYESVEDAECKLK